MLRIDKAISEKWHFAQLKFLIAGPRPGRVAINMNL